MDSSPTPRPKKPQPTRHAWPEHKEVGADYIGEVIDGRYRIVRRIAKGGMAHVFLAKDQTLKCHVALKILHRTSEDLRRRFELEVQVLSGLQHESMVRAIDYGTFDTQPYIALEHLEGETLAQRLARGPLPWREAAAYGIQIAAALQALHNLGVVHRDIKPENVMLAIGADRTIAKLIDLGLASIGAPFFQAQEARFASPVTQRHKTELGHPIGTPEYLPPEAGLCDAEPRLDVYSLAVTLYRVLTRCWPDRDSMRPLGEVCPDSNVPDDLSRLLRVALEPDVDDRLPSADHFARGLEAILAAHPPTPTGHLYGGCYDRLAVIGVGASAVAYRASDRMLERDVALKVLRDAEPTADDVIRFRRAAKILSALQHPNVPRILHFGVHVADGREESFAVTELCSGSKATDYTRPDRHLRTDEVLVVGRQLVSALAAVHELGIVYRDLHVGNVLIARGEVPQAWLFDFDHSLVSPEFYARLTGRHATPPEKRSKPAQEKPLVRMDYTAPEVKAGGAFTAASDVFALGLLLFRLLTGLRPFQPGHDEPAPARTLYPACPPSLEHLLLAMLSRDPGQRPPLAEVERVLADVQAELEGERAADAEETDIAQDPATPAAARSASEPAETPANPACEPAASPASEPAASPTSESAAAPARRHRSWALAAAMLAVFLLGGAAGLLLASRDDGPVPLRLVYVDKDMAEETAPAPTPSPPTPTAAIPPSATTPPARPPAPVRSDRVPPVPTLEAQLAAAETRVRRCIRGAPPPLYVTLRADAEPQIDGFAPETARACIRKALAAVTLPAEAPPRKHAFFANP